MNNKIIFLKLIFYTSLILLITISLFPGSLLGLIVFDDISRQPTLADNPIYELIPPSVNNHIFAATLNHFVFYLYISLVGFIIHMKDKTFSRVDFPEPFAPINPSLSFSFIYRFRSANRGRTPKSFDALIRLIKLTKL